MSDFDGPELKKIRFELENKPGGAIYAIGPSKEGRPVKIGWSKNPGKRLSEARMYNWVPLAVFYAESTTDPVSAERTCHARLKREGAHLHGGWFDVDAEYATQVIKEGCKGLKGSAGACEAIDRRRQTENEQDLLRKIEELNGGTNRE